MVWMDYRFVAFCIALIVASCSDSNPVVAGSDDIPNDPQPISKLPYVGNSSVVFSEINSVNLVYKDHEGSDAGWVELFNQSSDTVDLAGTYLTDNLDEPVKWKFGNVKIAPNDFMLVFMSGKDLRDFQPPHDSVNMVGPGCWVWTDAQNEDVPGESYADPLDGKKKFCFKENGKSMFGSKMRLGENDDLGWSSISAFVGTRSSDKSDDVDISTANEILLHAFITKDRKVSMRLAQPDVDDWKGYEFVLTGTGDSSTVYRLILPQNLTFPDLAHIYGTRFSPEKREKKEVVMKTFSFIARNRGHEPHANFKLGKKGGSLYLVNENQEILDSVAYPKLPPEKSWSLGSLDDAGALGFGYGEPSPYGASAGAVVPARSPSIDSLVEFPPSGFYTDAFTVNFPQDVPVRCAVGGLAPTEESPLTSSIRVDSTMTIRCASFSAGAFRGEELVRTYVFENAPSIPAVFLTTDPNSLFDPDSGIYERGNFADGVIPYYGANYWLDKEIPVTVELMEPGTSSPAFAKSAGLKIFGNYSRTQNKKSVAVTFREKYGDKRLNYKLFPDYPDLDKFKGFILRNNGNNFGKDYIRDRLASSISEGLGVDYQRGRPAVVYYNGEYYGIHDIRERSNEYYFETHYGMDDDEIDLLDAENSVLAGSSIDYTALIDWLESHTLDDDENYAYIASQIDIDNYLNYVHTELFADNRDWPANNLKKWRGKRTSVKWKWVLYDMDFGFDSGSNSCSNNIFEYATAEDGDSWPNGPEHTLLLRRLLENESFKAAFVNRMAVLLQMNFESSRVLARIEGMMAEIQSEIPRDQKRWKLSASKMTKQLNVIKDFAKERPGVVFDEMQEFFSLGKKASVTLSVNGPGRILVHNLPIDEAKMTVNFFEDFPVTLYAEPLSGSTFVGWSDGETAPLRIIQPQYVNEVEALFK